MGVRFNAIAVVAFAMIVVNAGAAQNKPPTAPRNPRIVEDGPDQMEICRSSPVPSGWVMVDLRWVVGMCGGGSPTNPNMVTIRRHVGRPAGDQMDICRGAAPDGWIVVHARWVSTICSTGAGGIIKNVLTIKKHQGLGPGSRLDACRGEVPSGWVLEGTRWVATLCYDGSPTNHNVMTIRRP